MESKPLISIITPCHRVIPWFNARLINVCSQSFKDWEWIILDNSPDGCVKKYVDNFFVSMQGVHYPECKNKIKCFHEPFDGISISDGRIGMLRNRCIELTSCGDNGWILTHDSDDLFYDGLLETIYDISKEYPSCEAISGMIQMSFFQNEINGEFGRHDASSLWLNCKHASIIDIMRKNNFHGNNFDLLANNDLKGNRYGYELIDYDSSLTIPHVNLVFKHNTITCLNKRGYSFFDPIQHPIAYKKGAFRKKIGGYVTVASSEDAITILIPHVLNDIVYIKRPCYMLITLVDNNFNRTGSTVDVIKQSSYQTNYILLNMIYNRVYSALGDCMNCTVPIWYE